MFFYLLSIYKMAKTLVRPPKIRTPNTNPFQDDQIQWRVWTGRFWRCMLTDCDPVQWERPVVAMLRHYDRTLKKSPDGNFVMPAGTRLFHGSTEHPFLGDKPRPDKITFFGLDAVIALWYILEDALMSNEPCRMNARINGFLYEFVLTRDIEITHLIPQVVINPTDRQTPCARRKDAVCLHPQISFHGVSFASRRRDIVPIFDLCSEVTLRYSRYKDSIKLLRTHHVDPVILFNNSQNPHFDPMSSIVPRPIYPPVIPCTRFASLFNQKKK